MGKKNIAKKFAAVKRIISSQDDRVYLFCLNKEKRIRKSSRNRRSDEDSCCKSRLLMRFRSRKCKICFILDPSNPPACSSHTTQPLAHPTAFCSTQTSSTSQSKTNSTSSKPQWTVFWANASPTSQTASSLSSKNSESSTESP